MQTRVAILCPLYYRLASIDANKDPCRDHDLLIMSERRWDNAWVSAPRIEKGSGGGRTHRDSSSISAVGKVDGIPIENDQNGSSFNM